MESTRGTGILTVAAIPKVRGETRNVFSEEQVIFKLAAGSKVDAYINWYRLAFDIKLGIRCAIR